MGKTITALTVLTLFVLASSAPSLAHRRGWSVEKSRDLDEVVSFDDTSANEYRVLVDNINGSIKVTGYGGNEVRLRAHEVVRARSQSDFESARAEAGLVIEKEGATIYLVVDGPFRRRDGSIHWNRDLGYDFHYDFEIEVPYNTSLILKTVNHGDIEARDVRGTFDVSNVNGAIEMSGIAGHGRVQTVNGGIDFDFAGGPDGECDFKTVNGNVDVVFPVDLAADLRFKTMNGEVYTDFDYTARVVAQPTARKRGERTVWKSLGHGARIGVGGPEISFETLNGDVYIRNTAR